MNKYFVVLFSIFTSNMAQASIIDFQWNNGWQDILTGYVDTEKNSLFVTEMNAWTPGLNHTLNPLQPDFSDTSLFNNNVWELRAVNLDGSSFDIKDDWNGILGGTWGFASDIATLDINYLNGDYNNYNGVFKKYMSIGIEKTAFSSLGSEELSFSAHGESYLNSDGTFYSQLSGYAAYHSVSVVPNIINEFPDEVNVLSSGGRHTISRRVEVPAPSSIAIFAISLIGLLSTRTHQKNALN